MTRSAILTGVVFYLVVGVVALRAQTRFEDSDANSSQMVGQMAPPWTVQGWVNSKPLEVKDLRGKVLLLRFLNDSASSAATLNELNRTYRARGLAVVGIYTPAPMPATTDLDHVRQLAAAQGFEFPLGLDSHWETLNRYWLQRADAELTATTFLIDRKGIVRYIQPDGQYDKNSSNRAVRREYTKLQSEIEILLKSEEGTTGGAVKEPKSN